MGLYSGGFIIGRIFASEIWGAYFQEDLFLRGLIIGILRYMGKGSYYKADCVISSQYNLLSSVADFRAISKEVWKK